MRLVAAALAGGAVLALLGGCSVDVGPLQHKTRHYSVPGPLRALVVSAHVGSVQITGGGGSQVVVTEKLTYRKSAPATRHRTSGRTLTLTSHCPALESCAVSYVITVPRTMAVEVTDDAGPVRLASLAGPLTVSTKAGDVRLRSVSGTVHVTGTAGSVVGQDLSSARSTLRMTAGRIDVTYSVAPARVTATTTAGAISLRVPGGVRYAVRASTGVGSARIGVDRSARSGHVITARATTGAISIQPG